MNKLLLKSIVTVTALIAGLFLAINAIILFIENSAPWVPAVLLAAVTFGLLVNIEYQRRKYNEILKK